MNPSILSLNQVQFSYHSLTGEIPALKDISFSVNKGEFLAIIGPSGCGKSTLLSIIAKMLEPESGTVKYTTDPNTNSPPKIGYMLQQDHLLEWRSIYENVLLGLEINHAKTKESLAYVDTLLKEYNLYPFKDKKPSQLSGGMRQRAALIRTLALNPDILLLDEPFSALDYQTRLSVSADICKIIRQTQKTAILITHDLSEAISLAERILVLSKRPCVVKKELFIHLTPPDDSLLNARKSPEFGSYFNLLWEELTNE